MTRRALHALAALALLLAPLRVAASDESAPSIGTLPHGGAYEIYRDPTVASAAIDLWFRAPGAGYDDEMPGLARLAATAAAAATLESGKSLSDFVHAVGGSLTINVYPDIIGVSIVVPANVARRTVAAVSAAYFAAAIDDRALKIAQKDEAVLAVTRRYSSDDLLHDALFAQLFASGPAHYAPLPDTVPAIARIPLGDVQTFAKRAFRSANATMTLAGNVDSSWVTAVTAGAPGAPDAPLHSALAQKPSDGTINGNVSGIGLAWTGPPIRDERAATAMDFVADYLFRESTGVVNAELAVQADTYVAGQFITLNDPGIMLVTIGGNDTEHAKTLVTDALAKLATPMDEKTFEAAREAFLYHLGADTQLPVEQADNLGWYAVEGNPGYAPSDPQSSYWQQARSLDPQYVASAVRTYLTNPVVVHLTATPSKESPS